MTRTKDEWAAFCLGLYAASTLVAMAAMSVGLAVAALALLLLSTPREIWVGFREIRTSHVVSGYRRAALALFAVLVLSLLFAWVAPVTIGTFTVSVSIFKDLLKSWYLFLPIILWRIGIAMSPEGFKRVLRFWLGTCGILSVVGIIEYFTGWPQPQGIPYTPGRYHATVFLGHHLSVASIWIFPAFTALSLALSRQGPERVGFPRAVLGGIASLSFLTLFYTYSRMLWLALAVGVIVFVFMMWRDRRAWIAAALLLVAGGAIVQMPSVRTRIQSNFGTAERYDLWEANWAFFKMRPVLGTGWRKSGDLSGPYLLSKHPEQKEVFAGHAHNNFLEVLAGTGAAGMAAWIFWCFTVFAILWKGRTNPSLAPFFPGLFAAWVVFHLNGLTQVNFWEGKVLHQMMWAVGLSLILLSGRSAPKASA